MNEQSLGGSVGPRLKPERNSILFVEDNEPDFIFAGHALRKLKIVNPIRRVVTTDQLLNYLAGTGKYSDRVKYPFPAIIVLDVVLPDGDGLNAQAVLRASLEYRSVPIVMISTGERIQKLRAAEALGVTGSLVKPFDGNEFVRLMHASGFQLEFSAAL
jgi:CheY-like chemotaxis protein